MKGKPLSPRVAFRADASHSIGTGHVMRCLTLAEELRDRGAEILFICRDQPGHLMDFIEKQGYGVKSLPLAPENDAALTIAALAGQKPDWLVVDHYGLDAAWETVLRPQAARIMVIDDLADRPHDCDLLLEQNFRLGGEHRYDDLVPAACRQLSGPKYALLRREFALARENLAGRDGGVRRILVSFGGSDPQNYTGLALDALDASSARSLAVDVIAGAVNPHQAELAARCAGRPQTRFFPQVGNMAEMLGAADLAIGAGGTTNWERAALALPSIVIGIADNQRRIIADLAEAGLVWGLPELDPADVGALTHVIEAALRLTEVNRGMAGRLAGLVDGKGAGRVAGVLMQAGLVLRQAVAADALDVFAWRNDPLTRAQSLDPSEIALPAHVAWFEKAVMADDKALLIGEMGAAGVGVVRFDIAGSEARVSIYLNPAFRGKGLGIGLLSEAMRWLRANRPAVSTLVAEVRHDNVPSNALFVEAGFSPYYQRYVKTLAS